MKVEPPLKFMVFMMNLLENTEILMFGNILLMSLISYLYVLSLKIRYSHYMVVYLPLQINQMILINQTENKKYLMKDPYVIYYGLILIILLVVGEFHQEVLDICLEKKYLNNLIILIILQKSQEPINYKWKVMQKHTKVML